jgi:alkylhydroperoxidase family enzyme
VDINSAVGRKAGLSAEKLRAVLGESLEIFSPVERAVIALADSMANTPSNVSDELYAELLTHFSEKQLLELGGQIAFENFRARLNRIYNAESDDLYSDDSASEKHADLQSRSA